MQVKFKILTLLRNDAPCDAIQRHFCGLTFGLNPLNALTKKKCQWAESAD